MIYGTRYLLDNNILARIPRSLRQGLFVQSYCRYPEEVAYESRGSDGRTEQLDLIYPMTASVLRALKEVMASVDPLDTSLVDLYHNRGNADPILVASALAARRESAQYLFGEEWVVVSDDMAVQAKASEFGVPFLAGSAFFLG